MNQLYDVYFLMIRHKLQVSYSGILLHFWHKNCKYSVRYTKAYRNNLYYTFN